MKFNGTRQDNHGQDLSLMLNWIIRMEQFVTQSCSQANGAKTYIRMAKFDEKNLLAAAITI